VRAGAFGDGMPVRDLWLSPDHAVHLLGKLFPVRCLINGATVLQERVANVTYYHVELPQHAIILAEGLPAESYLDLGNRSAFANGGDAIVLHPDFGSNIWKTQGCAELIFGGAPLAAARTRLLLQAGWLGHAATPDAALRVEVHGKTLLPEAAGNLARFILPPGTEGIRLRSSTCVPGSTTPEREEATPFGVAVTALLLDRQTIDLADHRLGAGWHAEASGQRWTDGNAELRTGGARELVVRLAPGARYWIPDQAVSPAFDTG
jgi:collagen type I/II/III/V/XI/XXIV/XXVII alpha